ncbi:hypothetical protein D3C83_232670 [compost metagenome]
MVAVFEREFGAGDGLDSEGLRCLRELHRAVEAVVVSEGERGVAEFVGAQDELVGTGCAIEQGPAGVQVELCGVAML